MIYVFTCVLVILLYAFMNKYEHRIEHGTDIYYNKNRIIYHVVIAAWFIVLLTLRHDYMFTDTQNYHAIYDNPELFVEEFALDQHLGHYWLFRDAGFYAYSQWMHNMHVPFRMFLFLHAVLYVGSISYFIYKYSQKSWLSYIMFMTCGPMAFATTMRQSFATSFILIATAFALKRKLVPYIVFLLLAISFHTTSIVAIPIYFIVKKWNIAATVLAVASFCAVYIYTDILFQYFIVETDKTYDVQETGGYLTIFNIAATLIAAFCVKERQNQDFPWLIQIYFIVLFFIPFAKINPAFFRIYIYYSIFSIILTPNILATKNIWNLAFCSYVILFCLLSFTVRNTMAGVRAHPYVFYWENYFELNPEAKRLDLR